MKPQMTTRQLLEQRKLTRTIGEVIAVRMQEYVTTLTPLFRQRAVFGDHIQGSGKEAPKLADQAFAELQALYASVATSAPYHLPRELKSPLLQQTSTLELSPWEYPHEAAGSGGARTIVVTCPFKRALTYAGYGPRRLRELLGQRNRNGDEVQQFVLHYLTLHVVLAKQPGLARILEALHFPIVSATVPGLGALPVACIGAAVSTGLPPDELVQESADISGKDVFEELANVEDIGLLRDPLAAELGAIVARAGGQ